MGDEISTCKTCGAPVVVVLVGAKAEVPKGAWKLVPLCLKCGLANVLRK